MQVPNMGSGDTYTLTMDVDHPGTITVKIVTVDVRRAQGKVTLDLDVAFTPDAVPIKIPIEVR